MPVVDLSTWTPTSSYASGDNEWTVYYVPVDQTEYLYIQVIYDALAKTPATAIGTSETVTYDMPDLTGYILVLRTTLADGSMTEKFAFFEDGQTAWSDVEYWAMLYYDPNGDFVEAELTHIAEIPLDELNIPDLS
ncbi:MAG: hypothetical protein HQL11_03725 [Candidatus Omnitrophica bacterium]|nr:hypothetical protein [Candidatus Omnitrophota bacterium]